MSEAQIDHGLFMIYQIFQESVFHAEFNPEIFLLRQRQRPKKSVLLKFVRRNPCTRKTKTHKDWIYISFFVRDDVKQSSALDKTVLPHTLIYNENALPAVEAHVVDLLPGGYQSYLSKIIHDENLGPKKKVLTNLTSGPWWSSSSSSSCPPRSPTHSSPPC